MNQQTSPPRHAGPPCPYEQAEQQYAEAVQRRDAIARKLDNLRAERDELVAKLSRTEAYAEQIWASS